MTKVSSLGYFILEVSNVADWHDFAVQQLGLEAVARSAGGYDLRLDGHAWRIRLVEGSRDDIICVGWEVADADELEAARNALIAADCEVSQGSDDEIADRRVAGLLRFIDPEGLTCELFYGPLLQPDCPTISATGTRFRTGDQGLGHIVLTSKNPQSREAFYTQILGFRVSDYIDAEFGPAGRQRIRFLRCNSRHHSLAFVPLPLPRKLQHFMLEAREIDDVGRALDRMLQASRHITLTLGRHSNDDMLSFYVQSPSGIDVEYGWGGLTVDDDTWNVRTYQTNSAWGHRFQRPPRSAISE
jgi:2,3-dihydroxybiphenyl 1,2-dioxygenase